MSRALGAHEFQPHSFNLIAEHAANPQHEPHPGYPTAPSSCHRQPKPEVHREWRLSLMQQLTMTRPLGEVKSIEQRDKEEK